MLHSINIGIKNEYLNLIVVSVLFLIIVKIVNKIIIKIYGLGKHRSKDNFKFHQFINIVTNIIYVIGLFIIWENHLKNIVTIISYVSAATTIALRDVIINLFAGFYIRFAKPFVIEDRVKIADTMGDVVKISSLSFKILETSLKDNNHQSNGIIVNIPNSLVFSQKLQNYTTEFKYIWTELHVPIKLEANIEKNKRNLEKIVANNEIIKAIPKKMDRAIDEASKHIRIYFNNLEPIIYTSFVDDHIDLAIRYLVHPKKERTVEDQLWTEIIKSNKNKKIDLFIK